MAHRNIGSLAVLRMLGERNH